MLAVDGYQIAGLPFVYDVAPDGERILVAKPTFAPSAAPSADDAAARERVRVVIVQNWTEELKRLVPAK